MIHNKRWEYNLKSRYNITARRYYNQLLKQYGCCDKCNTPDAGYIHFGIRQKIKGGKFTLDCKKCVQKDYYYTPKDEITKYFK